MIHKRVDSGGSQGSRRATAQGFGNISIIYVIYIYMYIFQPLKEVRPPLKSNV